MLQTNIKRGTELCRFFSYFVFLSFDLFSTAYPTFTDADFISPTHPRSHPGVLPGALLGACSQWILPEHEEILDSCGTTFTKGQQVYPNLLWLVKHLILFLFLI